MTLGHELLEYEEDWELGRRRKFLYLLCTIDKKRELKEYLYVGVGAMRYQKVKSEGCTLLVYS